MSTRGVLPSSARVKANQMVTAAIKRGDIKKQPCERCGKEKAIAHHDDYSKPLDVMWLCTKHHGERHREIGKLPQKFPMSRKRADISFDKTMSAEAHILLKVQMAGCGHRLAQASDLLGIAYTDVSGLRSGRLTPTREMAMRIKYHYRIPLNRWEYIRPNKRRLP